MNSITPRADAKTIIPVDSASRASATVWHATAIDAAFKEVNSSRLGLTSVEAKARLRLYGENGLPSPRPRSALMRFIIQFHNVLIYVLLASAVATALMQHWLDAGVIAGVILINAVIGFIQEGKAEAALVAIRRMLSPRATVLRDGQRIEIAAEHLVPGDVVYLQSGDRVPADLRLIESKNLHVDEAVLTGESLPVEKSILPVAPEAALGDRHNMTYSGTFITRGQGSGVVVATGKLTELGQISALLERVETLTTPLLRQMAAFGRTLTWAILGIAGATFAFGYLLRDYSGEDMFMAAVGLAVSAIPEGLPAVMTITLAIGVRRMAHRNAIIRRLPAVETLGSVTTICTDKTGTLTKNEMTVRRILTAASVYDVSGSGYAPHGGFIQHNAEIKVKDAPDIVEIARAGLLCNDATLHQDHEQWVIAGDPTEGALITLARKAELDPGLQLAELPRIDTIPFESEHRFMATLHHDHAGHGFIYLKGAPERVLELCRAQRRHGRDEALNLAYWHPLMDQAAGEGYRLLALAFKTAKPQQRELQFSDIEGGFTLLGVCAMQDPPREEAIDAVARCRAAGIHVKMITGDHAATARAIGMQLGIGNGSAPLTGEQLEKMSDEQLRVAVGHADVFARASPAHKLRIVQALQAEGHVVAMTGDGANDAPALKRADVGVAMGIKGTEVAKESSEMVLADDNFASIAAAVEEGRTVYDNLRKSILFMLPTNGGEAGIIIVAILFGIALPITPVQILWVNMVTEVTLSLVLSFETPEKNSMDRPPRPPAEPLLTPFLIWRIVFVSLLLVCGVIGLYYWETARGLGLEAARTVAVNALVMGEVFYLFNSRYIFASSLTRNGMLENRYVWLAIGLLVPLQLLFTYSPVMQSWFGTEALDFESWAKIFVFGFVLLLVVELEKYVSRRRAEASGRTRV